MNRSILFLAVLIYIMSCVAASARDIMSDTWVATDALGRSMPDPDSMSKRDDKKRTVGIFYITWHDESLYDSPRDYRNVDETLQADTMARFTDRTGLWNSPNRMGSWHWGEPENGYFLSNDRWVIQKDISMLSDAGVDVLILDVTNGVCYWEQWDILFDVMAAMKEKDNEVPQICFWAFNGHPMTCAQQIYERYYKTGQHKDLWFYWDGKPLFLCNMNPTLDANGAGNGNPNPNYDPAAASDPANPHYGDSDYADEFYKDYSKEVKDFFTLRNMWWGYNEWGGKPYAGTEDNWCFGYEMSDTSVSRRSPAKRAATHKGRFEQMAVTAGQHPISMTGKCWRIESGEPALNCYDMVDSAYVPWLGKTVKNPEAYGIYFQDRWDEALSVDPDFIYLNDWNEWTAGKYAVNRTPDGKPNGPDSFLGRKDNTFYFVDQYNAEFNRTIQPAKGVCADNYYMQMAQNIRRYKGARQVPQLAGIKNMKINGKFDKWAGVPSYFLDTRGDIMHRDHNGYAGHHYTNTSGRNDIVESKVAVGKKDIAFYVQCDSDITPYTDPNWMLLLIDADNDPATGWHGYDFIVNRRVDDARHSTLERYDAATGQWLPAGRIEYSVQGKELELAIPRKALGLGGDSLTFDFKWADNPESLTDPISLCTHGDTAPNRRFNYRCRWSKK